MIRFTQNEYRKMIDELLAVEDGLNSWEIGFVEDMYKRADDYTDTQSDKIEQIWTQIFG